MKKASLLEDYLQKYACDDKWRLITHDGKDVSCAVVIPAYAEKKSLFFTLASLAKNSASSLEDTLVLCVINNRVNSPREDIKNNLETLEILASLVGKKSFDKYRVERKLHEQLTELADKKVKIGYIDAAGKGAALPPGRGGVGMARKIGMDAMLRLWQKEMPAKKLLINLDADTLVEDNYLSAIKNHFSGKVKTAVTAYAHKMPPEDAARAAICFYEIYLRYWVLGLRGAKSPYAYQAIGSTIITTTDAYLEVRGMNRRQAGEDFYFLNKLAKVGKISYLRDTRVYPSARPSLRVPFGTGKSIHNFLTAANQKYLLYDPRVFAVVGSWVKLMEEKSAAEIAEIKENTRRIHPCLEGFLKICRFEDNWSKISANAKSEKILVKQFHLWFDAFKTLKLINYLTREAYPQINMFTALREIRRLSGCNDFPFSERAGADSLDEQMSWLKCLREIT